MNLITFQNESFNMAKVNRTEEVVEEELVLLNNVNFYVNDIIGSVLFIFGMVFNLLSFAYFQISKSFRDTSMRHYFSVLSISDSLRLSEWLFQILIDKMIIFPSKALCRAQLFVFITSGHISVWLLVFLSIERYIILQFPFRGKQFYTTKNSLRMLCAVITIIVIVDIPYLLPNFIEKYHIDYKYHLHMCLNNPQYRSYMFVNNVLFYSLIPFIILLVFNCLLISLLARRNNQLFNAIKSDNAVLNAKRERQFKERTIMLMFVTFFLVITVSPRYFVQMIFMFIRYTSLFKVTLAKILSVLEMLNFSLNFFFYIICSKTSRKELIIIFYYFFYWKWSENSKKIVICNHPNHNPNINSGNYQAKSNKTPNELRVNTSHQTGTNEHETNMGIYNQAKKNTCYKIHCFLSNYTRIKILQNMQYSSVSDQSSLEALRLPRPSAVSVYNSEMFLPQNSFKAKTQHKNRNQLDVEQTGNGNLKLKPLLNCDLESSHLK
jgi:hypothetical protein